MKDQGAVETSDENYGREEPNRGRARLYKTNPASTMDRLGPGKPPRPQGRGPQGRYARDLRHLWAQGVKARRRAPPPTGGPPPAPKTNSGGRGPLSKTAFPPAPSV